MSTEAEEYIEGDWNGYYFKLVGQEDIPLVLDHLKNAFYKDETMFKLIGYSEALADEVNQVVEYFINKNDRLSLLVYHQKSNKVTAVRVTYKNVKDEEWPNTPVTHPDHIRILPFVKEINAMVDVHEKFHVDHYAELFMTSVEPQFRRQGIVTELYKRNLKMLKNKKYPLAESFFTSPYTRAAASKFGFNELYRIYYADALDENGQKLFPEATSDQFTSRMIKILNP